MRKGGGRVSEETMEPRTFEDLWLMRETSKEWFDGQLRYENVRNGADPEVGMVDSMSWHVAPSSDRVRVYRNTHIIEEVRQNGHSLSLRTKSETLASYDTMEAFRASEWWDLTMEKFAGGDADASWLRTIELDGEEVDADPIWIGYGPDVTMSVEVGNRYRDWLGNNRQGKGHKTLDVRVDRLSGEFWLKCGEHEVEGTVEEIEKAVVLVERLRRLGIEVGSDEIRVPLAEEGDESGY